MIRRIQESDAAAVAALDGELFPDICLNENSISREIKIGWGLVVTDQKNRVIGFLLVRLDGAIADIVRLGIAKKHQSEGHGKALLKKAIDELSCKMMLTVHRDNDIAKRLYLGEGFKPVSSTKEGGVILVRNAE